MTDIQRDLSILTREEIEAALHYYLNHKSSAAIRARGYDVAEACSLPTQTGSNV